MHKTLLIVRLVGCLLAAQTFMVMTVIKCRTDVSTGLYLLSEIILFMFVFYKQAEEYIDEYY